MSQFPLVTRQVITMTNLVEHTPAIVSALMSAQLIGLDIETEDSNRHAGLADYNGRKKKLVFDLPRTTLCGLSLYPKGSETAWYFNLGHSDVANRIPWSMMKQLLDLKSPQSKWVVHNAAFERTMLKATVDYDLKDYLCTFIMAVSAYSPDEYDIGQFAGTDLAGMNKLIPDILRECAMAEETQENRELLNKVIAKESDADHSYNGYVKNLSYGYGLKQAVQSFFDYKMVEYGDVLERFGAQHMGELTSQQTADYGCDDAIWCCRLYDRLLQFMMETNPGVFKTYIEQELPMVEAYSEAWREGVRIDTEAVLKKREEIRGFYAEATRRLKAKIKSLLPFDDELNENLLKHDAKYGSYGPNYRRKIEEWIYTPDDADPFRQATQLKGAVPDAWAADRGIRVKEGLNLTFWMCMRVIMYDLCRRPKVILEHGKVQSDAYARGRIKEGFIKDGKTEAAEIMTIIGELATVEQVSKLYLTPYMALVDPDTSKLHPVISSELATRRTAMSTPNAQQLAKRGESVYVRDFYLPDYNDHVIVSIDWSQIELVLIGEFSGDPYFRECYGQLPYRDLHEIAAADCLSVDLEEFRALKKADPNVSPHLLVNPKGETMDPKAAFKYWRTEVGKGSNFSYWYSGALSQVGERLGWTKDEMFEASDRYRARFSVAEEWRLDQIRFAQQNGYVELPDGHRRTRFEAMPWWAELMRQKFGRYNTPGVKWFADQVVRRIQARANNQSINALIQGSCATLAKRSIHRVRELGIDKRTARFMFPIHDELVYSVQRDFVPEFLKLVPAIMNDHPDIIGTLKMDCSPSVGLTFAPWDKDKFRLGQLELREIPKLPFVPDEMVGGPVTDEMIPEVVSWLFEERRRAA